MMWIDIANYGLVAVASAICGGLGVWFWVSDKLLEARFERDRMKLAADMYKRQRDTLLRADRNREAGE